MTTHDAERDVEYTAPPWIAGEDQGATPVAGQGARRGNEPFREALSSVRAVLAQAMPETLRYDRASRTAPVDARSESDGALAPPLQFSEPSADEQQPQWLTDVLCEQEALLGPTQASLPLLMNSQDAAGPLEIGYYHAWLDNESQRRASHYFKSAWRGFAEQIGQAVPVADGQAALPFTTIDASRSAITTLTRGQAIAFLLLGAGVVVGLYVAGPLTLTLLLGASRSRIWKT